MAEQGDFIIYQSASGQTRLEVRLSGETVWLTQKMMAELFQTSVPNINMHLKNITEEQELVEGSVIQDFLITASDGKNYRTKHHWNHRMKQKINSLVFLIPCHSVTSVV